MCCKPRGSRASMKKRSNSFKMLSMRFSCETLHGWHKSLKTQWNSHYGTVTLHHSLLSVENSNLYPAGKIAQNPTLSVKPSFQCPQYKHSFEPPLHQTTLLLPLLARSEVHQVDAAFSSAHTWCIRHSSEPCRQFAAIHSHEPASRCSKSCATRRYLSSSTARVSGLHARSCRR